MPAVLSAVGWAASLSVLVSSLQEHGTEGGKTLSTFEELLSSSITVFVEEELREHFGPLISFVKTRAGAGEADAGPSGSSTPTGSASSGTAGPPVSVRELEPLFKDFAARWKVGTRHAGC